LELASSSNESRTFETIAGRERIALPPFSFPRGRQAFDHVVNKKADVVRVYLPPDANTLLSVADHCLRSRNYVNVIVAGKQPALQWLDMKSAIEQCATGLGIWEWASTDYGIEPDVVMACAGDTPTLETMAVVALLREHFPDLRVRVVNVVDLMTLQTSSEHPHGLPDREFDSIFTTNKPVIFAYHGYPTLGDAADRAERLQPRNAHFKQHLRSRLIDHTQYVREYGDDLPEIRDWKWPY
jgi:xylulose-5-phosphate/fructose-6-phosphate phosphoketolase